jgi:hypothetical protein
VHRARIASPKIPPSLFPPSRRLEDKRTPRVIHLLQCQTKKMPPSPFQQLVAKEHMAASYPSYPAPNRPTFKKQRSRRAAGAAVAQEGAPRPGSWPTPRSAR